MKYTLKNRPTIDAATIEPWILVEAWFEGFEKELRDMEKAQKEYCARYGGSPTLPIREVLGE